MTTESGPRDTPASRAADAAQPGTGDEPALDPAPRLIRRLPAPLPGLLLAAIVTLAVLAVAPALPTVSPMVLSLLVGAVAGSLLGAAARRRARAEQWRTRLRPGTAWTATHVLRAGVVLLGFQVSIPQVLSLGWRGLAVVGATMAVTLVGTVVLGRRLRLPRATVLLVATGYAVCGAAAVSAMRGVLDGEDEGEDESVATALALVTLFGSVAILALPWLAGLLGLSDHDAGLWIGASVQEVAQVVTAAGSVSAAALTIATVAKLTRVALLAPLVAVAGFLARRKRSTAQAGRTGRALPVPAFVIGFCVAVALRSLDVLPADWISVLVRAAQILFVAALFTMGLGIDAGHLVRTGRRSLVLGALAAVLVTAVALVGVLL